jgi:CRP-like cAMP-binding protein
MGLIDGEPRSATCIAATDLSVGLAFARSPDAG